MLYLAGLVLFSLGLGMGYWLAITRLASSVNGFGEIIKGLADAMAQSSVVTGQILLAYMQSEKEEEEIKAQ